MREPVTHRASDGATWRTVAKANHRIERRSQSANHARTAVGLVAPSSAQSAIDAGNAARRCMSQGPRSRTLKAAEITTRYNSLFTKLTRAELRAGLPLSSLSLSVAGQRGCQSRGASQIRQHARCNERTQCIYLRHATSFGRPLSDLLASFSRRHKHE
jgi:hypothetical protein